MIARDSRGRKPGPPHNSGLASPHAQPVSLVPRRVPPQIPGMPSRHRFLLATPVLP